MRALTTIEQSLLENVIRRFLDKVAEGWAELAEFKAIVEAREMDPQFVQVIPSSEMVLVSTFSISAPGELEPGELCFCVPFISIDTVMQRLGNRFRFASMKREPSEGQRRHLDRVIKHSTLPVQAKLGTASVSLDQIMTMKPGDVIVLDQRTSERAVGLVGGKVRFLCSHGRLGKAVAVRVERVLPPGKSPHDKD
jgi:flagellar motor switch protein FliM